MKRVVWLLLIVLIAYAGCADKKMSKVTVIPSPCDPWWTPGGPSVSLKVHENVIAKWKMAFNRVKEELDRVKEELKQSELQLLQTKDEQIHLRDINKLLAELDKRYVDQLAEFDKRYVDQLAELDKRYVDQLAEFDKRYAERQQQWELRCQLQWQTTWWLWQVPWQWPLELHWQPLWYRCKWHVLGTKCPDTQKGEPEYSEPEPVPKPPSEPESPKPSPKPDEHEREKARKLAESYLREGKDFYDKGYFDLALEAFHKAEKYQEYLTVTYRKQLIDFIKKAETALKETQEN